MNYRMIGYTLGWILMFEAGFLLVPLVTSIFFFEWWPMASILITMVICGGFGFLFAYKKPENKELYAKDGLVIVALSWIVLSLFGAFPFVISGSIPNYIDAFFEIASGFTTTGSTVITSVENIPKCMLMWRSFSNWVGGMGVL
ncbi:MAG: TrkH family potassium uptake protein, partial [Clostridia bacterium]|nr:TrkH family potassium uptake protein [Clostridia bacterium]